MSLIRIRSLTLKHIITKTPNINRFYIDEWRNNFPYPYTHGTTVVNVYVLHSLDVEDIFDFWFVPNFVLFFYFILF